MREYAVKVVTFAPHYTEIGRMIDTQLYKATKYRCEDLVGKTVYCKSLSATITVEAWYEVDNEDKISKDLILVFTCDKDIKEPGKLLPEILE